MKRYAIDSAPLVRRRDGIGEKGLEDEPGNGKNEDWENMKPMTHFHHVL